MSYSGSIGHNGRNFFFRYKCWHVPFYHFKIFPNIYFLSPGQQFTLDAVSLNVIRAAQYASAIFLDGTGI